VYVKKREPVPVRETGSTWVADGWASGGLGSDHAVDVGLDGLDRGVMAAVAEHPDVEVQSGADDMLTGVGLCQLADEVLTFEFEGGGGLCGVREQLGHERRRLAVPLDELAAALLGHGDVEVPGLGGAFLILSHGSVLICSAERCE
jgi:hypothetical protein